MIALTGATPNLGRLVIEKLLDSFAEVLADSNRGFGVEYLFVVSGDLRRLTGRTTTPLSKAVAHAL